MPEYLDPETVIGDCLEKAFGLEQYLRIMEAVKTPGFALQPKFRECFNGFYRVQRRSEDWYNAYYTLMEAQMRSPRSFTDLLCEMRRVNGWVEVSFVSKLIATADPSKPIWDQYVIRNLGLEKKWNRAQNRSPEERIEIADGIYREIIGRYNEILASEAGRRCIALFDAALPDCKNRISDTKKIDFFLWSKKRTE